jgi:hypothetical protein
MGRLRPLVVTCGMVLVLLSATPLASAAPGCGPPPVEALRSALSQMSPDPSFGLPWSSVPVDSNYDSCADLSTMVVTIEGGTGSSPEQALMFHRGQFLGTGTLKSYPFTAIDHAASTDDTVVLSYKDGRNVCTACDGPRVRVRYQWQSDHVQMLDPPPPW